MVDVNMLPFAIGIAISPIPIIAVILMLFSVRAKSNSIAFAVTWFLTVGIVSSGVVLMIVLGQSALSDSDTEKSGHLLRLILSSVVFVLAFKNLHAYRSGVAEQKVPKWMTSIDLFTPMKSVALSALLSGVNPKNLSLIIGGAVVIAEVEEINSIALINLGVFAIIASFTVVVPVVYYIIVGKKAEKMLNVWKKWLSKNNAIVMFWVLLILGVILLIKGITGLT